MLTDRRSTAQQPATPSEHPLEALLRPRFPVVLDDGGHGRDGDDASPATVVCTAGDGEPEWVREEPHGFRALTRVAHAAGDLSDPLVTLATDDGRTVGLQLGGDGAVRVPFSFGEAYTTFVAEEWRAAEPPRSLSDGQLATFYRVKRLIPRRLQLAARRALIRAQGRPDFPSWPLDTGVPRLLELFATAALAGAGRQEGSFTWFWPDRHRAALVLTHDVEVQEGISLALELADVEEELGFRSSFNFGGWYDVDPGVLRELVSRGFEVGMHGLTHDRALFASREAFEERLPALAQLAQRLGAVGFRSPATHRVFDWLGELPIEYDTTIPNSDPYEPIPGGCCTIWPFLIGPVVELPYTMPQDHTLLTLLGHRTPELWLSSADAIAGEHGMIEVLSHPDRGYLGDADKRAVYRAFLEGMAERDGIWRARARDVADWWRRRAQGDGDGVALGTARLVDGWAQLLPPSDPPPSAIGSVDVDDARGVNGPVPRP